MSDLSDAKVLILMGSKSDWATVRACADRLEALILDEGPDGLAPLQQGFGLV